MPFFQFRHLPDMCGKPMPYSYGSRWCDREFWSPPVKTQAGNRIWKPLPPIFSSTGRNAVSNLNFHLRCKLRFAISFPPNRDSAEAPRHKCCYRTGDEMDFYPINQISMIPVWEMENDQRTPPEYRFSARLYLH